MKIGTLTTGDTVQTVINLNYVPQYLYYVAATALKGLKVAVAGDGVIVDLDEDGIKAVSGIRRFGAVANSYYVPIANGFIPNKVTTITFTNSAAQTPDIFGHSLQKGSAYITSLKETVLASSGRVFTDFAQLAIESMAEADQVTVEFYDGHIQDIVSTDLLGIYTLYSNEVDSYCFDNVEQNIKRVKLIPAANRTAVVTRYAPIALIE
jgi:hypothetical protein